MKLLIVLVAVVALTYALPAPEQLNWQPPEQKSEAQLYGEGGFHHRDGVGVVGFVNPNGSGGQVKYGHESGFGQSYGADVRVPIYTNKNRYGESTVNLGAGADYYRGVGGSGFGDKRVGLNFNYRF
ncbi:uncharacterized protein LOC143202642 [Rhynchophorus ferrugineus]|uniref:uncharacterized protein LOC143202642 n=1 Tax=Rhynchophorus ferrugineus TaxID=354439 RepID=UPI003FCCDCB0